MDVSLVFQFVIIFIVVGLIVSTIHIKSIVANTKMRKYLGGAVVVVSSMFGGSQHMPKPEPKSEKSGELKDD